MTGGENFVSKRNQFIVYSLLNFQPVKRFEDRGDSASKGVLDVLKSIYLGFRKVKVQRVTVVEFGMYDRSGDSVGCLLGILLRLLVVWVFTAYFHRVVNITVVG